MTEGGYSPMTTGRLWRIFRHLQAVFVLFQRTVGTTSVSDGLIIDKMAANRKIGRARHGFGRLNGIATEER